MGNSGPRSGVAAHAHVGAGQVGVVGKGGGVLVLSVRTVRGVIIADLAHARANMDVIMVGGSLWEALNGKTATVDDGAS